MKLSIINILMMRKFKYIKSFLEIWIFRGKVGKIKNKET